MSNNFNFTREFFNHYEVNSTSESIQKYCLLWKSVIAQAIADAINTGKKTENLVTKCKALSWLSDYSQDFVYTCMLADCDPREVKNKIQPILNNKSDNRSSITKTICYKKLLREAQARLRNTQIHLRNITQNSNNH